MRIFKPRDCHTCSSIFTPTGPKNVWCSELCRMLDCCDHSGGDDTCWDWKLGLDKGGYGHGNFEKEKAAHRAMYRAFYNFDLTPDHIVRHKCDRPRCLNPAHLELGTHADNSRDMWDRGRQQDYKNVAKGVAHGSAKLTEKEVLSIYADPRNTKEIADQYALSQTTILKIKNGSVWTSVTNAPRTAGTHCGERKYNSKLTADEVVAIYRSSESSRILRGKYGVSATTIQKIRRKEAWDHVTRDL